MCDVWKNKSTGELESQDLFRILSDPLFRRIRHVGISGGEPTLRSDLVEIVKVIFCSLKQLKSISITTHGFHVARWKRLLPEIQRSSNEHGIDFVLNLSLDGIQDVHDRVRGIPGGYERVLEVYRLAHDAGVQVKFQTTVSRPNIYGTPYVSYMMKKLGTKAEFRIATNVARLNNIESMKNVGLNTPEKSFFADFLISPLVLRDTPSPARRLFYRDLAKRLTQGLPRSAPCSYQREGVLLNAHGDLFHCSISTVLLGNALINSACELYFSDVNEAHRKNLHTKICPGCLHDQSGAWTPSKLIVETFHNIPFIDLLMKNVRTARLLFTALPSMFKVLGSGKTAPGRTDNLKNILIIGMYGGEHVGDSAILGGILKRFINVHGTEHAVVVSFRPDRTQRWVQSLKTTVVPKVISYDEAKTYIDSSDAVVLAGGPVMDLLEVLLRQLIIVEKIKTKKKLFIIEGVGIGPFKRALGRWLARLLFKSADLISLRSARSQVDPLVADLQTSICDDPAFDYLADRVHSIPSPASEAPSIGLQKKSINPFEVGINLRPLWNKYIVGSNNRDDLETQFLMKCADSLIKFQSGSSSIVNYHFFPMNSDQYGFSDLAIAYRMRDLLPSGFPYKIWEAEPNVDEVLRFMQSLNVVIAMRLHAAVFAISQSIPVLGIDYSIGKSGKVNELFKERGIEHLATRVDAFTGKWLFGRLTEIYMVA